MPKIKNLNRKVSKVTFTYHNYTNDTIEQLELLVGNGRYNSIGYSDELGLINSKHLQGVCILNTSRRLSVILKEYKGANIEVMRGSIKHSCCND
jgi:hypothetical protein